jgi:hypothetical protein
MRAKPRDHRRTATRFPLANSMLRHYIRAPFNPSPPPVSMRSSIEVLESRIAPAGAVAVTYTPATGALVIAASDNDRHSIHIFPTGVNTFRIEPQHIDGDLDPDTTIGTDFYRDIIGKVTSVQYTGGDGYDEVKINNFKSITTLTFEGQDGVDTLTAQDITTTGNVSVNLGAQSVGTDQAGAFFSGLAITIGGNLSVDYGAGGFLEVDAIINSIKGGLTLTGGGGADQLFVDGNITSIAKGISFTGNAGDDLISFDGGARLTVGPAADGRALFFDGGADKDTLEMFNDGLVNLQGKVLFDGGAGDNNTIIRADALTVKNDLIISGAADADFASVGPIVLKVGGDLRFNFGDGANEVDLFTLSTTVTKTLAYQGGAGTDDFALNGTSLTISGGLSVALADGVNSVDIGPRILKLTALPAVAPLLVPAPALAITGGADGDTIDVSPHVLTVTGATSIDGGVGTNTLKLNAENGTFTKDVQLIGGNGDDTMEFGRDFATLKANLTFTLGDGTNSLDIAPDVMTIAKDLKITGLGGDDTVNLHPGILRVTGLADINLADGANVVDGFSTSASYAKTLSYHGGSGSDDFSLSGTSLSVKGAVNIELFGGTNDLNIGAATTVFSDTLTVLGYDGVNTIFLGDRILSIAKATTITLGSGGNDVSLGAPQSSFGAVTVTSTDGDDSVQFNGTRLGASGLVKFDLGGGQDSVNINSSVLALKAGLTILGGADADDAYIFADGTITGDVNIDLGGAADADQTIYLTGNSGLPGILKITGALTLNSSATDTGKANVDYISVFDVTVTKAISATGGAANSAIYFNNASTGGSFTIDSGAGNDDVGLETFGTFGSMTIAKTTSIMLGEGNDNVAIGFDSTPGSNDFVRFFGPVTVDGGNGTDTKNGFEDPTVNFYGPGVPVPVVTNFP